MIKTEIFNEHNIVLEKSFNNKYEAIVGAGSILYKNGYVEEEYIKSMVDREQVISTFIGNKIAIPHGVDGSECLIQKTGISFIQVPQGVSFGEDKMAYLIIGIAGKNDEHMDLLMNISLICCEMSNVEALIQAKKKEDILKLFTILEDEEIFLNGK